MLCRTVSLCREYTPYYKGHGFLSSDAHARSATPSHKNSVGSLLSLELATASEMHITTTVRGSNFALSRESECARLPRLTRQGFYAQLSQSTSGQVAIL